MKVSRVKKNFKYRLIGTKYMKKMVISTLSVFPDEIIDKVSECCWFISSFEDGWAFVLRGKDIKKERRVCDIFKRRTFERACCPNPLHDRPRNRPRNFGSQEFDWKASVKIRN